MSPVWKKEWDDRESHLIEKLALQGISSEETIELKRLQRIRRFCFSDYWYRRCQKRYLLKLEMTVKWVKHLLKQHDISK